VPGAPQKLKAEVTLKDGQKFTKSFTITPKQGASKATLSKKAVTLNRWTPLTGDSVSFGLKAPKGAALGEVCLNQASLNALKFKKNDGTYASSSDGFKLVKSGASDYTLYFADGKAPMPTDKNGNVSFDKAGNPALKSGYNIKLELWAEGTYKLDSSGKPVALEGKNAKGKTVKSKPTIVTIKVNIK
jgi:hypothetical protein